MAAYSTPESFLLWTLKGGTSPGEPEVGWLWFPLFQTRNCHLPGLMGNWQKGLRRWARGWNIQIKVNPTGTQVRQEMFRAVNWQHYCKISLQWRKIHGITNVRSDVASAVSMPTLDRAVGDLSHNGVRPVRVEYQKSAFIDRFWG